MSVGVLEAIWAVGDDVVIDDSVRMVLLDTEADHTTDLAPEPNPQRRFSATADPGAAPRPSQTLEQRSYNGALIIIEDAKAASVAKTLASGQTDVVNAELKAEWEVEARAVHNDARATTELKWVKSTHTTAVGALWKAKTIAAEANKVVETAKLIVARAQKDMQGAKEMAEAASWIARASWDSKAEWLTSIREAETKVGPDTASVGDLTRGTNAVEPR
ncbi:hypothetical protein LCGC14_0542460 [marine sediment metagenome]|uniref:Uncharacterized protein n=1 Tax=marine sediment metagenome TaxID=412755 RepID=A0A0F9UDU0_9ZZZZ